MSKQISLGTSVTYLHSDHLGSLSAATTSSGALVGRKEYTPWGAQRGTEELADTIRTALDFTSQRKDLIGLLFYNARYYDPVLGRFVSADSIVPGASGGVIGQDDGKLKLLTVDFHEVGFASTVGEEDRLVLGKGFLGKDTVHAGPSNPQALNRYTYTLNNPVRYIDPSGHCAEPISCGLTAGAGATFFCGPLCGIVVGVGVAIIAGVVIGVGLAAATQLRDLNEQEQVAIDKINQIEKWLPKHPDLAKEAAARARGERNPDEKGDHVKEAQDRLNSLAKAERVLRNPRNATHRTAEAQREVDAALRRLEQYQQQLNDALSGH